MKHGMPKRALHCKAEVTGRAMRNRNKYKPDGGLRKPTTPAQERLLDLATHRPQPIPKPPPLKRQEAPPKRVRWGMWLAIAAAALGGALVLYFYYDAVRNLFSG
jgi:hypothetical protein